jgi:nucleotide-binding universal stress UspA family protein
MLPNLKTILYATDLGHHAPVAFRYALSLAHKYEARIHVVHAVEPLSPQTRRLVELYVHPEPKPDVEEERLARVREAMAQRLRERSEELPVCNDRGECLVVEWQVVSGKPADAILQEARRIGADVIVMGSHGHTTVGDVLLGSTAHRVLQKSTVPVLLVRLKEGDAQDAV